MAQETRSPEVDTRPSITDADFSQALKGELRRFTSHHASSEIPLEDLKQKVRLAYDEAQRVVAQNKAHPKEEAPAPAPAACGLGSKIFESLGLRRRDVDTDLDPDYNAIKYLADHNGDPVVLVATIVERVEEIDPRLASALNERPEAVALGYHYAATLSVEQRSEKVNEVIHRRPRFSDLIGGKRHEQEFELALQRELDVIDSTTLLSHDVYVSGTLADLVHKKYSASRD